MLRVASNLAPLQTDPCHCPYIRVPQRTERLLSKGLTEAAEEIEGKKLSRLLGVFFSVYIAYGTFYSEIYLQLA